ncbi:MAG TPA: 4-alpha-glucanotransferase [Thermoanaerobaculia bacterium]|nr:4-alpha-glucanotransferase [Thermoanaerobaculia bacterium]
MTPSPTDARTAGILLHPTSLPGSYGIGDLGDELIAFLDWMASAGMRIWQVLPLNPPGYGFSPYGCLSSFAGNPLLISPQRLLQENLLSAETVAEPPTFADDHVEFTRVERLKMQILRASWEHFRAHATDEQRAAREAFVRAREQSEWLDDYALYMAMKETNGGAPWWEWPKEIVARDARALDDARHELAGEIEFWMYVQFLFFRQWASVREAAHARSIRIMGDVPIYVAGDSADVWANRELFQLDETGFPINVAGVPPDYFSATGQRWGNPLYRWDAMRESGYRWWISRVRANLRFADLIRLDHFRGFAAYWEIPASEETAIHGRWMPGPGLPLFEALRTALGDLPLIAEDLGFITQDVHDLRRAIGLPGMKILQFAFGHTDSPHLPHLYEPRTVVYTGTHDNDTARGWYDQAPDLERVNAEAYLGASGDEIAWAFIRTAFTSIAQIAIIPAQDVLGLGTEARMNRPGAEEDNWSWRIEHGALTREHAQKLHKLAEVTGRV